MTTSLTETARRYFNASLTLATLSCVFQIATAQQLQQGVSVQLAQTSSASARPDADNQDAWIVTVTADGSLYLGVDPVTPSNLVEKMKSRPRQPDQKLYIKADARAPFSVVRKIFAAAHEVAIDAPVLLTSQPGSTSPGAIIPPNGLEVHVGPHPNKAIIVVQVNPGQPSPTLQVNDQAISEAALKDTLKRLLQEHGDTPVLVKTSGPVAFAPVVHVIDTCHSIGARVMLSTPLL